MRTEATFFDTGASGDENSVIRRELAPRRAIGRGTVVDSCRKLLGRRIRQLRKFKDWTQEQLAHRARMDSKSLGAVERGERNITIDNIAKISRGLAVDLHQLFLFSARAVRSDEEMTEEKILDAIRVAGPRKKTLMLGILSEVIQFPDR